MKGNSPLAAKCLEARLAFDGGGRGGGRNSLCFSLSQRGSGFGSLFVMTLKPPGTRGSCVGRVAAAAAACKHLRLVNPR